MKRARILRGTPAFKPSGKRTRIGRARGLGEVEDYGPTRTATVIVGLNRGMTPTNRAGSCAIAPKKFSVAQADRVFVAARAKQVGAGNVAVSRTIGRGYYQGKPEAAVRYELIDTGSDGDYAGFQKHVNTLAEDIGKRLCQDEVFVVHDDSDKRRTVSAARR